jgi:hypothetical protein
VKNLCNLDVEKFLFDLWSFGIGFLFKMKSKGYEYKFLGFFNTWREE